MITLGSKTWGSSPAIGMSFAYEKKRVGADMQYRAKVTINALTGASYFGYPIYMKLYIGGTHRGTTTLKSASPSQWSSAITYTTDWHTEADKTSGTTAITFNIYSGSGSSRNTNYTYSMAVDPAASVLSAANGTLGTAQTLTVTRYDTSFTHTVTYACGDASGTVCTKSTSTSVSFTPPLDLAAQNTTGTSVSVVLTATTYSGDTVIGTSTKTITCAIPSSVAPTVSLSVADAAGYLSTYGGYVQNKSTPKVTVTASGAQGSSIKSYATTLDGNSYAAATFTASALKNSGTLTVETTVTDSRGRTETASTTITSLAYESPKITAMSVRRCNSNGTAVSNGAYLKVTFDAAITSLSGKNTAAYKVQYKKSSDTTYTEATLSNYADSYDVTNGTYMFSAESVSYDVVLTATDAFSSASKSGAGAAISKFFSWLAGGLGWAFGKVAEKEKTVEFADDWDLFVKGSNVRNGLAAYTGAADNGIDPDTTLDELILTSHTNAPQGRGTFYYIHTAFYSTKSETSARAQVAFPYSKSGSMYHRYYRDGAWSAWTQYMNTNDVYPVGSIVIRYDHTSPASLYGGTWTRVIHTSTGAGAFLYGCTAAGVIGEEGGEAAVTLTNSELPALSGSFRARGWNSAFSLLSNTTGVFSERDTAGTTFSAANSSAEVGYRTITMSFGGDQAHNNIPPFVKVSIWRRTA